MRIFLSFCFLFFLFSEGYSKQMGTIYELIGTCGGSDNDQIEASLYQVNCLGYMQGYIDAVKIMATFETNSSNICLPEQGLANDLFLEMLKNAIQIKPDLGSMTPRTGIYTVIKLVFPCKE